ncbi:hypothetical protein [Devosia sp. CAU 1758]
MPDILHKVGIKTSSPQEVYVALTTLEGFQAGGPAIHGSKMPKAGKSALPSAKRVFS